MASDPATDWMHQLVIQFPWSDSDLRRYDEIIALEGAIDSAVGASSLAAVDGHDAGVGEMNIYLFTNEPQRTFAALRPLVERLSKPLTYKVAYRDLDDEAFHILWPEGLKEFDVA